MIPQCLDWVCLQGGDPEADNWSPTLNTQKTRETITDFRKASSCQRVQHVERVYTFRFLGVFISPDISWTTRQSPKKAQQPLHYLRILRTNNLSLLLAFCRSSIGEPADKLHCSLVQQLHHRRQGDGSEDHWTASTSPDGHLYLLPTWQSKNHHPGLFTSDLFHLLSSGRRYR